MENAVEALKNAFAVMMFVMALTLSISSFSTANSAVTSLIKMNDRENEYTYVEPAPGFTRTVGIETVVSSIYRAFEQNIEIYFKKSNGDLMPLFYKTQIDIPGYIAKDSNGDYQIIYSIDQATESPEYPEMYIDIILGGVSTIEASVEKHLNSKNTDEQKKYIEMYTKKIQSHFYNGLYNEFKNDEFIEEFGEYYQGEGASKIKKRVITYTLKP